MDALISRRNGADVGGVDVTGLFGVSSRARCGSFFESGCATRFDCTGSVCGALAGALAPAGIDDFPADWVAPAISANRQIYGFDIEQNAQRMFDTIVEEGR